MKGKLVVWEGGKYGLNRISWRIVIDKGPEVRSRRMYLSLSLAELAARKWAERFGVELNEGAFRITMRAGKPTTLVVGAVTGVGESINKNRK